MSATSSKGRGTPADYTVSGSLPFFFAGFVRFVFCTPVIWLIGLSIAAIRG
ncbi:MAG: hypothetical protein P8Y67_15295 [Alphaproteobacteria bacterium]